VTGKNVRSVPGTNRTLPINRAFGDSNFLQKCPLGTGYEEDSSIVQAAAFEKYVKYI